MTEEQPVPLTDDELDALDAEIARDMALVRAMNDDVMAKVRRFRAGLAQRGPSATVHEFRARSGDPEPGDFRTRPSGPQPPPEPGPREYGNGGDPDPSSA